MNKNTFQTNPGDRREQTVMGSGGGCSGWQTTLTKKGEIGLQGLFVCVMVSKILVIEKYIVVRCQLGIKFTRIKMEVGWERLGLIQYDGTDKV